jgi:hypothetical protein
MTEQRSWLDAKVGIGPDMADEFLELLATDDEFRDRLARDAVRTLADYYIVLPEGSLPDEIELPSKEESLEFLEQTRRMAGGKGPGPRPGPVLGFAILYRVLGPVPYPDPTPTPPPTPPPPPEE